MQDRVLQAVQSPAVPAVQGPGTDHDYRGDAKAG
jgi:hypothetical protein